MEWGIERSGKIHERDRTMARYRRPANLHTTAAMQDTEPRSRATESPPRPPADPDQYSLSSGQGWLIAGLLLAWSMAGGVLLPFVARMRIGVYWWIAAVFVFGPGWVVASMWYPRLLAAQ